MNKPIPPKGQVQFNKTPQEIMATQRQLSAEQQMAQDRMNQIKSGQPKGVVPSVKIPPLDATPIDHGGSMSAQANVLRDPTSPLSPVYSPELAKMKVDQKGPFNTLPPEAINHPQFVQGMGSMIAANQPHVASDLNKASLSKETVEGLEALADFRKKAEATQRQEAEKAAEDAKKVEDAIAAEGNRQIKELREFVGDETQWNLLFNPTRKKEIENRLLPLDVTDLILRGEIKQTVPIIPTKLVLVLRTSSGEEDLGLKRMMFGETGGDRYLIDRFALMNVAISVVSINGSELPSHTDANGKFSESNFLKKFELLMKYPMQLLADIGIQCAWFDERVKRLLINQTEELKNS